MINKYAYALLLGLVLLRSYPPQWLINYIETHIPEDKFNDNLTTDIWLTLTMLRHAPNMLDEALREIILRTLKGNVHNNDNNI